MMGYQLIIVGHCPSCGAPIYGQKTIQDGAGALVRRTCLCSPLQAGSGCDNKGKKDIRDTMETK